ncbi:lipid-A-disaccharide synthase [bacterium CG2_30_54_10]|nr:MAG: lipid-A-disaccharide synthase [bacterium CG2_30_54_10]
MNVFFIAGEHSGDLQGSLVISHMKRLRPDLLVEGIGGPLMTKAGQTSLYSIDEMAVIGFIEVLRNLRHFLGIFGEVKQYLATHRPDMLVLIDYPGFNTRVAKVAKELGIYVVYYITPQVWAWHASRVHQITRTIDEAVVVFPFEEQIWKKAGARTSWFGHPLVGISESRIAPEVFRAELGLGSGNLVSLLPGSRAQEIHYILPVLLDAAELILQEKPATRFLLPLAGTIQESLVRPHLKGRNLPLTLLRGQTYEAIGTSDLALVASGTATLETAILGTPMIIVYQTNVFTSIMSKFLIQKPHIGLPNVISGRQIVPEFIRWRFRPELIAEEALSILGNARRQDTMRRNLAQVRAKLGEPGASDRVARHLLRRLDERLSE